MTVPSGVRILPLFQTPVYTTSVADGGALNRALADAIVARRVTEPGATLSNVGGWQSHNDMLAWGGVAAAKLAELAIDLCGQVVGHHENGRPATDIWHPEMWANINEQGASNQTHWHPGSFLSLVYYVADGYAGSDDRSLGGELVLLDPRHPYVRMRTPDLRSRGPDGQWEDSETWVRPRSGLLIAFPSWLGHSVRPYHGQTSRISIAINMIVRGSEA